MLFWIKLYFLFFFFTIAGHFAESALEFTLEPDNPTHVMLGHNAYLVWEYNATDRQKELGGITWNVYIQRRMSMIVEDSDQKRKDANTLPSSYKGRVSVEGSATLVIRNVTLNDSRSFSCSLYAKLGSGASNTESVVSLIVTVPPTVIVVPPSVRYVDAGDSATFTCNASGIPTPNITWYRDGKQVSGSHYQVVKTAESSQLTIKSVSHADHGYYVCRASSNGMEPAEARYFLGVIKALLKDSSLPVTHHAKQGGKAVLNCPVISHPPPEVEWKFKSATVEKSLSTVLVIPYVNETSFGLYSCTARSLEGTSKTFNISLEPTEPAIIVKGKRSLKPGAVLKWDKVEEAWNYLLRLAETEYLKASFVGVGNETFCEIPYGSLQFKSENADVRPNPANVTVDVFAMDKNSIIGKQNRYVVEIFDSATTATVSLLTLILSLMVHYLQ